MLPVCALMPIFQNAEESTANIDILIDVGAYVCIYCDGIIEDYNYLNDKYFNKERVFIGKGENNQGLLMARKSAYEVARRNISANEYRYVVNIDGGSDKISTDCFENINHCDADVVEFNGRRVYGAGKIYTPRHARVCGFLSCQQMFLSDLVQYNIWLKFVKREVWEAVMDITPQLRLNFAEDVFYTGALVVKARDWKFVDQVWYTYDNSPGSMSRKSSIDALDRNMREFSLAIEVLGKLPEYQNPFLKTSFLLRYLRTLLWQDTLVPARRGWSARLLKIARSRYKAAKVVHHALLFILLVLAGITGAFIRRKR